MRYGLIDRKALEVIAKEIDEVLRSKRRSIAKIERLVKLQSELERMCDPDITDDDLAELERHRKLKHQ